MRSWNRLTVIAVLALFFITGCKEDSDPLTPAPDAELHDIAIRFYPKFGSSALAFNKKYLNAGGDSVQFTVLKFYLSEISLIDTTGKYIPMTGLSLVDFSTLTNGYVEVKTKGPDGTYRGITFSVGVPSSENHKDASTQAPPLGPNAGMYWAWNPGYIFHKVEGKADSVTTPIGFSYHIGEDSRKATILLATMSGTSKTSFVVEHHETNSFSVAVDYSKMFSVGLDGVSPMKVTKNSSERIHHVGPAQLANRTFANSTTLFSRIL
jgi:hypothetical protein